MLSGVKDDLIQLRASREGVQVAIQAVAYGSPKVLSVFLIHPFLMLTLSSSIVLGTQSYHQNSERARD